MILLTWDNFHEVRRLCHWGPVIALSVIAVCSTVAVLDSIIWYWPLDTAGGSINFIMLLNWTVLILYNYFNAMFVGPGYIPLGWKPENQDDTQYLQFCKVCQGFKAPRAHHCRKCNRCVMKMDHHCPWINNCCGHQNHAYFTSFLLLAPLGCAHAAAIFIMTMYTQLYERISFGWSTVRIDMSAVRQSQPLMPFSIAAFAGTLFALGLALGTTIAVGMLFVIQMKVILRNKTSIESWIEEKAKDRIHRINLKLKQLRDTDMDVTDAVPLSIIKEDVDFFHFMVNCNESLCAVQIKALAKIHAFVLDSALAESRQADIRKQCLSLWGVPDKARVTPASSDAWSKFYELVKNPDVESFKSNLTALNSGTLEKLRHVLDHRCIVGGREQIFLLTLGKSQIYTWDGKMPLRWQKLENFKLELPRDSLLSVEIVQELKGEGKAQRRINAVHVMDALILNGTDVRDQHFNKRIEMAEKFVKAVAKPSRPDMNPIRVKEVYRLEEMEKIFVRLEMKVTKSSGGVPRLSYTGRDDRHFLPTGLYIIKTTKEPWMMAYSKNSNRKYFYNKTTKESLYDTPADAASPFHTCHAERLFWAWEDGVIVHDSQTRVDQDKLSKDDVLAFIHHNHQL